MSKPKDELSQRIEYMLENEQPSNVLEFVKVSHQKDKLADSTLALLFIAYVNTIGWEDEENGISPLVRISDLCDINVWFQSTNGCQWARSDNSFLGKQYIIERPKRNGSVYAIKLNGFNDSNKRYRGIKKEIVNEIKSRRCVVLDTSSQIEVDHKNGRYTDDIENQTINNFQPLHKSVNDAKREHCKKCLEQHKRYDAKRLGYKEGWIEGDESSTICNGCYWYDPQIFNQVISKDFIKNE